MGMTCADCHAPISAEGASKPCPGCGSLDRNVSLHDYGAADDAISELTAEFPPSPTTWQAMWVYVELRLARVREWYSGGVALNVNELEWDSYAFFVACYHVKDYLKSDPQVPQEVERKVEDYVHNESESLALAGDITNTFKHRERTDMREVRIIKETIGQHLSVIFGWTDRGIGYQRDCLELAEEAVTDWRRFFQRHALS
jgi:hypothetical protein